LLIDILSVQTLVLVNGITRKKEAALENVLLSFFMPTKATKGSHSSRKAFNGNLLLFGFFVKSNLGRSLVEK